MKKWASGLAILMILIVMVPVVAAKFVLLPNGAFENCKVGTDITGHQPGGWYFNSVDVKDGGGNKYIVLDAARSSYVSHKINSRPATIRFYVRWSSGDSINVTMDGTTATYSFDGNTVRHLKTYDVVFTTKGNHELKIAAVSGSVDVDYIYFF